jgi:hypothetical protein
MVEKLIRCIQCNQVTAYNTGFGDFGETPSLPGVEWSAEDLYTKRAFFLSHGDHPTEEIFVALESIISDKPSYEPNKVSYFEAGNGRERFLLKRTKESLGHPAFYEIIPGIIRISNVSFKIQENDLRKQLLKKNGSLALKKETAQTFIEAYQEELERIPPERLSEKIEIAEEGENPLLIYASLKPDHWQKVLQRCQKDLQKNDLQEISHFIHENNNPGDVLSLVIQRKLSIITPE